VFAAPQPDLHGGACWGRSSKKAITVLQDQHTASGSATSDGVTSDLDQARTVLQDLHSRLLHVEKEAHDQQLKLVAAQVNKSPKGEFETTKEYNARIRRARNQEIQIGERITRQSEKRKADLNRQIGALLARVFYRARQSVSGDIQCRHGNVPPVPSESTPCRVRFRAT
jgi:hypothetical protein